MEIIVSCLRNRTTRPGAARAWKLKAAVSASGDSPAPNFPNYRARVKKRASVRRDFYASRRDVPRVLPL